jgi:hypothetical protein
MAAMTDSIAERPGRLAGLHDQNQQRQLLESMLIDACAWHELRGRTCRRCAGGAVPLCGSCSADQLAIYVFSHLAYRPSRDRPARTPADLVAGKRELIADAAVKARAYRQGRATLIDWALAAAYAELAGRLG